MRRRISLIFFTALAVFFACSPAFASPIGTVTAAQGKVELLQPGSQAIALDVGSAVSVGDMIRTKSSSRAEITFDDRSVVKLGEKTLVDIKDYEFDAKGSRKSALLNVERGKVRAVVAKSPVKESFKLVTPNASSSVKGTDLVVSYMRSATSVGVLKGSASVESNSAKDKRIQVASGDTSLVDNNSAPTPPRTLMAVEKKYADLDTTTTVAQGYSAAPGSKAVIISISGGVRVKSKGSSSWHNAKETETLFQGDTIETKSNGSAEIATDNGNIINLKPGTELVITKLSTDPSSGTYENLFESGKGKLRAKVIKLKGNSKFEVKTPTAVASVRGTIMFLSILGKLTTAYFEEGTGHLTSLISGAGKFITMGNSAYVDENGNISNPQPPSGQEQSNWESGWGTGGTGGTSGYDPNTGNNNIVFNEVPFTDEHPVEEGGGSSGGGGGSPTTNSITGTFSGSFTNDSGTVAGTVTSTTTAAPWIDDVFDSTASGTYSKPAGSYDTYEADINTPGASRTEISVPAGANGAYTGWLVGAGLREVDGAAGWDGTVAGIYLDSSGYAGWLFGYVSGNRDSYESVDLTETGTFSGSGELGTQGMVQLSAGSTYNIVNTKGLYFEKWDENNFYGDGDRYTKYIEGQNWGVLKDNFDSFEYAFSETPYEWTEDGGGYYASNGYIISRVEGNDDGHHAVMIAEIGQYLTLDRFGLYIESTYAKENDLSYVSAVGSGIFIEEPLTFNGYWGEIATSIHYDYYDGDSVFYEWAGDDTGLIGATETEWWDGNEFGLVAMGEYSMDYSEDRPYLWNTPLNSLSNGGDSTLTCDGGAFVGYVTGISDNEDLTDVKVYALAANPSGMAGIVYGDMEGEYYPGLDMWDAEGGLTFIPKTEAGYIDPADLYWYSGSVNEYDLSITDFTGAADGSEMWLSNGSGVLDTIGESDDFGIFNFELAGYVSGTGDDVDEAYFVDNDDVSFFSEGLSWQDRKIVADLKGIYLDNDQMYRYTGALRGVYTEIVDGIDASWIMAATGYYERFELSSSGVFSSNSDILSGNLGTAGGLWGVDPFYFASTGSTGTLALFGGNRSAFYNIIRSFDPYDGAEGTYTTYSPKGAFKGYTCLAAVDNALNGYAYVLYLDPDGNAGIFSGDVEGAYSLSVSEYVLDGNMTKTQMETGVTITPANFTASLNERFFSGSGSGDFGILVESPSFNGYTLAINGHDTWGIMAGGISGVHDAVTDNWKLPLGATHFDSGGTTPDGYLLLTASGPAWSNGGFEGTYQGIWLGLGDTEGTFNAGKAAGKIAGAESGVDTTFKAAVAGEWVELAQLTTSELGFDQSAIASMVSVPITETYSALLTQTNSIVTNGTISNMSMDLSMYAGSTQQIWAALFSGNYTGTPDAGWNVTLANGSYNATLSDGTWTGNNWTATVNGTGPDSATFSGAAGGTYTGTGTLQGVGAGIWDTPK